MLEHLEALKGYSKDKEYVVAKHSSAMRQRALGRKLLGEIPDSSGDQNGTLQVWELNPKKSPVSRAISAVKGN